MCDYVPLSVLALDLGGVPAEGWADFLGRRAIAFVPDSLGRDSVTAKDARILLDEHRENQLRAVKHRQRQEQQAIENDERRRAQIWKGLPADRLPVGVGAATALLAAAKDARPRRRTPLEESLAGQSMTFHSFPAAEDEAS
jgi:hypothetical protein